MSYLINPYIYGGLVPGYILFLDATNTLSYPGSGTTWNDLSGNGYNGTLINNPAYTSSNPKYFTFNYTNNYVTTTGMSNYSYTNGITISVWNYNGGGTGSYRGVATNGITGDRTGGFDLRYGRENYFGGTNNGTSLYWTIYNAAGVGSGVIMHAPVNEWHLYTFTYNNTILKTYRDGSPFSNVTHSSGGQLKTVANSTTIGLSPGSSEFLDGRLSKVIIYDRPLNDDEISKNFNVERITYGL
jgi:hypothetical protein